MKKTLSTLATLIAVLFLLTSFNKLEISIQSSITGAWHLVQASAEQVLILQDGYFSHTVYDKSNKKFISTYGGVYKSDGSSLRLLAEFDTRSIDDIGKEKIFSHGFTAGRLTTDINGAKESWTRLDEGKNNLSGIWRITGRMVDGQLQEMPRRDRKTLKLLSGSRFQWMAINPTTKEFFGTGGGTYTFVNGKYTERIEFFSRDSSRVGASLSFDGNVKDGIWNHSGKSSKGDPINEVWTREKY